MEQPKVSIIMPAYNAGKTISESIQSVLDQSYNNWELIVINDGSKDNTSAVVKDLRQKDKRIILNDLTHNAGLSNARNTGCKMAQGEFIAFLDSDDLWHKDKLSIQVSFHQQNQHCEISHTDVHSFNHEKIFVPRWWHRFDFTKKKHGLLYPQICYRNPIGILTVMLKRDLLNEVGFFDTSLWTYEDQDLWVRIAKMKKPFGFIPKVLAYYRLTPGGMSRRTGKYKRASKHFIRKVTSAENIDHKLIWRAYYRKFGSIYFDNKEFKLSRLYFFRSVQLVPFDLTAISTYRFLIQGLLKEILQRLRSGEQSKTVFSV